MVTASDRVLRVWRGTTCFVVAFDVVVAALKSHFRPGFDPGSRAVLGAFTTPALAALCLAALAGLFLYSKPRARWVVGAGAFVAVRAVFLIYERTYPAGHEDFVQGSAAYLGWLFGHGLALIAAARVPAASPASGAGDGAPAGPAAPSPADPGAAVERLAATGFLAAIATTYVSAGLSKLVASKGAWVGTDTLRLMVISHYEYGMNTPLDRLRAWLGDSPTVCGALSVGTIVIQVGAFALVGPPRLRALWAGLLIAFHAGIWVSSRILFVQVLVILAAVVVPWDALRGRATAPPAPAPEVSARALDPVRLGRAVLVFLASAALVVALGRALHIGNP